MPDPGFWGAMFGGQPATLLDYYNRDAQNLAATRLANIKNALGQIQLNYAPQMAQQAADEGAAKVSIAQNAARFAPQLSQLAVQQKQIMNAMASEKFKEMPQEFQEGMALKAAQLQQIKQKMLLAPQQLAQQQGRFGNLYQLRQILSTLSPSAKAAFIAAHPDQMSGILGSVLSSSQGASAISPTQNIQPIQPNVSQQPNVQNQDATSIPQMTPIQQQQNQMPPFAVASQISANKSSVSPYISKKLDNTIQVDKFLESPAISLLANSAAQYSGIKGKGQQFIDRWSANNSENFENNLQFRNSFTSDLVNLEKNLEQLSVQPSQRKELINNIRGSFDEWSTNPERAIDQFNRTLAQLKDIAGANSIAAQPLYPGIREKLAGLPSPSTNNLYNYMLNKRQETAAKNNNEGVVDVISPDGREGTIPADNLEKALSRGYKRAS